jgi:hypothetical protein
MYAHYKPLRNYLRGFDLWSGLGTTYFYMQYLQFRKPLPEQLSTPLTRIGASNTRAGLFEFIVELLARELILNGQIQGGKPFTTTPAAFKAMNMIYELDNKTWGAHASRSNDIMIQLSRIAFKQFPWQSPLTNGVLSRYHMLYSHTLVAPIVEAEFGMTANEFFQLILFLVYELMQRPTPTFAFLTEAEPSIRSSVEALSDRISRPVTELRQMMVEKQSFDVNWAYSFNPLREFPLINMGSPRSTICPAPPVLLQRLTDGLYFDLMRADKGFGDAIGHAFEAYVGKVAEAISNEHFTLVPEMRWGKPEKRSVDWIIADHSATLFVECKLARLDIASQTEISPEPAFVAAIERLAKHIGQLYATLSDALAGRYPHWQPDTRPIHPIVVTFYNWFAFGPFFYGRLDPFVVRELETRRIDCALLERYPFSICSIDEFEGMLTACREHSIDDVLTAKNSPSQRQSLMRGFLGDRFPGCLSNAMDTFDGGMETVIKAPSRLIRRPPQRGIAS